MLTLIGWIDGLTASFVVIFGILFGFFFIYKSKKTSAKILVVLGLATLFAGLSFLGVFLDFVTVLISGVNIDNTHGIVGILSYIWIPPAIITAIYIGAQLLIPKKKWIIVSLFVVLSVFFEVIIFLNPFAAFNFVDPPIPGTLLIDYNTIMDSIAGILMAFFLLSTLILLGFGFLIKAFQSSGVLKKKLLLLSLGAIFFCVFGLLEGLTAPGLMVIFVRLGYIASFWFMYYGLKN
ncbi:MAG: hypothetical protein ACTSXN_04515 [Promethearchaeota archaeon]